MFSCLLAFSFCISGKPCTSLAIMVHVGAVALPFFHAVCSILHYCSLPRPRRAIEEVGWSLLALLLF